MLFKAVAALALAGAAVASPVKRQDPTADVCQDFDTESMPGSDQTCPALQGLAGLLQFQGDNLTTESSNILNEVLDLIGDSNPVSRIAQDATTGLVSSLAAGVVNQLYFVATSVSNLNPECRCNAALCLQSINNSQGAAAGGTVTTQASCAQTKYNCGRFFSSDEVNDIIPACSAFNGTTAQNGE